MTTSTPNSMNIFVIGNRNQLYERCWVVHTGTWTEFQFPDGNFLYEPVSISRATNDFNVFVVDTDHNLLLKNWNGSVWSGMFNLNAQCTSPPAVSCRGNGTIDIFHIGRDQALYHHYSSDGQTVRGHSRLSGTLQLHTHSPTCVSWGEDHIAVFAVGLDSSLYYGRWTSRSGWSPMTKLGGQWTGPPKAVSDQPGNIDIFGICGTNINHISYSCSEWSTVRSMEGLESWYSTPEVISWGPCRIDIFAIGKDSATYHAYWGPGGWSGWTSLGGVTTLTPKAISRSVGRLDIFIIGPSRGLFHRSLHEDGSWETWEDLGGTCLSRAG